MLFYILINSNTYISACETKPVFATCEKNKTALYPAVFPTARAALAYASKYNLLGFVPYRYSLQSLHFTEKALTA